MGELLKPEMGWKWEIFTQYLPRQALKLIQAHELQEDQSNGDLIYWKEASKGKFTIKSALRIIRNENDDIDNEIWDMVWHAPVQQRI